MSDEPGAPVTMGALARLLIAQVPAIAQRSVLVPTIRLGTVESFDGYNAGVTLDGDPSPVTVQNAQGAGVWPGQRVVVEFYPPHGALVIGVLGTAPGTPGEQVWTAAWEVPTSATVAAEVPAWTIATPDGAGGWDDDGGDLVCVTPGWWDVDFFGTFETDGAGDHRAFGLEHNGVNILNASEQFAAPGGGPTIGFGLAMTASSPFPFETGDVLTAEGRQNSGDDLDATLRLHLRWFAPLT